MAIAVIGAGACVLPSWLASLSHSCRIAAVECSSEVIEAARRCFGLDDARVEVFVKEGVSFVTQLAAQGSYDAMLVTAGGMPGVGEASAGEQLAPPASMAGKDFAAAVLRALRPGGVYAVNILCRTEEGSVELVKRIRETFVNTGFAPAGVHVATSGARPHRNFLLFATAPAAGGTAETAVSSVELAATYASLVGTNCRTLPVNVRWQCFEEWIKFEF